MRIANRDVGSIVEALGVECATSTTIRRVAEEPDVIQQERIDDISANGTTDPANTIGIRSVPECYSRNR